MQSSQTNDQSKISKQRFVAVEGVINFRDLGGYQTYDGRQVKWGKVFRSAQLDRVTAKGVSTLAALDVQTVIDLRFSAETERYPTNKAAFPNAEILSWHQERQPDSGSRSMAMQRSWRDSLESEDPHQVHEAMRSNYPKKLYSHRAIYRTMLLRLISGNTPLVFHCAAGKDRTGVAAALILSLLGVSDEQIVADYLLTQQEVASLLDNWVAGGATDGDDYTDFQQRLASYPRTLIQPVFDADEAYITTLFDYVDEEYGGFEKYAQQKLELSDNELNSLRENLLD